MDKTKDAQQVSPPLLRKMWGAPFALVDARTKLPFPDFPNDPPEIAFWGRSNVGKSSFINALTQQNKLARASGSPGRTRQVNFFANTSTMENKPFLLVDLPGYGFARASKKEIRSWNALMLAYILERPQLRTILLLIDARHGLKENDLDVMQMFHEAGLSFHLILTKIDKLGKLEQEHVHAKTKEQIQDFPSCYPEVFCVSSEKKTGITPLQARIYEIV